MWALIKFLFWLACAMAFGVLLSTVRVGGKTPVQRLQEIWKTYGVSQKIEVGVGDLKEYVAGAIDNAKDKVTGDDKRKPSERHSPKEREAINKLVAKKNHTE